MKTQQPPGAHYTTMAATQLSPTSHRLGLVNTATPLGTAVLTWVLVAVAIIGGIAASVLDIVVSSGLVVLTLGLIALLVWRLNGAKSGVWLAMLSMALLFILPFEQKITGIRLFGLWQILIVAGGIFGSARFLRDANSDKLLLLAVACLGLYLGWAGVSSLIAGRTKLSAFSYQFISNFKPFMVIGFGYFCWRQARAAQWFWLVVDWYWLIAAIFITFEWVAPGVYFSIFGATSPMSVDNTGLLPSRAVGTFEHPSFLASLAANFAMLCVAKSLLDANQRAKYRWLAAIYIAVLFASVQRQELVGCLAALVLIVLIVQRRYFSLFHLVALVLVVAGVAGIVWLAIGADIYREAGMWGVGTISEITHPRAQQYAAAFNIANERFPFGSGLGTFGGAGAEKFDLSLYYEMGFGRYWWFGKQDFLLDTYWPNSIAEGGWVGFGLLMVHYLLLAAYAIKKSLKASGIIAVYWLTAGLGILFLIVNGFSSPAFQDPRLFYWVGIFFGLAQYERERA